MHQEDRKRTQTNPGLDNLDDHGLSLIDYGEGP